MQLGTEGNLTSEGRVLTAGVYDVQPYFRTIFPDGCVGCDSANTNWGLASRPTSHYSVGSAAFFAQDYVGSPLLPVYPDTTMPRDGEVFRQTFEAAADFLTEALGWARRLGISVAVGKT